MKGWTTFNVDAELASESGRELGLPALTHRIFPTILLALHLTCTFYFCTGAHWRF